MHLVELAPVGFKQTRQYHLYRVLGQFKCTYNSCMTDQIALRRLVGENIRSMRKARGWSQEELGERAALSYKFVGEIERGLVNPSMDSLLCLSNALSIEVAKLFLTERLAVLSDKEVADIQSALALLGNVFGGSENKQTFPPETGRS